jgi:hypothetical protein
VVKFLDFFLQRFSFDKFELTVLTYKRLLIQIAIVFEDICQLQGTFQYNKYSIRTDWWAEYILCGECLGQKNGLTPKKSGSESG